MTSVPASRDHRLPSQAETDRNQPHSSTDILPLASHIPLLSRQLTPYTRPQHHSASPPSPTHHPNTDPYFLNIPSFTLFSALHENSRLLGISCLFPVLRQSPPGTTDLPLTLHPVPLQMEVYHLPYIDCLPLPKLRHNLIMYSRLIDDEAFCSDLTSSLNCIAAGSQSWDASGWVISETFTGKWAVLFQ